MRIRIIKNVPNLPFKVGEELEAYRSPTIKDTLCVRSPSGDFNYHLSHMWYVILDQEAA